MATMAATAAAALSCAPSPEEGATTPVTVVTRAQRTRQTAQTPGMLREQLFSSAHVWIGEVRTEPGIVSGWHHHADYESFIYVISGRIHMEFGDNGAGSCDGEPGDLLHVPRHAVHRESNPGDTPQIVLVTRVGSGDTPVYNVDGPACT